MNKKTFVCLAGRRLLPALAVLAALLGGPEGRAEGPPGDLDWPQYQHDASRSGYNPAPTPWRRFVQTWFRRFLGEGIANTAQPIVRDGKVLVGTERGDLYAFDLASGKELWKAHAAGAICHTPAASATTAFTATMAGTVHAFDLQTGRPGWTFKTLGGFSGAVLLLEESGRVIVADRRGTVHALDAATGREIWKTQLGDRIFQSPCFGGGRVFVGCEDMKLYALNAAAGEIAWSSPVLLGTSFHDYCPVYAAGKVFVNVIPTTRTPGDEELLKQASSDPKTPEELARSQELTVQWLGKQPAGQTCYAFDAATGEQPYKPGILHTVVNGGPQPQPIFAKGSLYSTFSVLGPQWARLRWYPKDYGAMGRVDLATGRVVQRLLGHPGELTQDETNNYSAAGDLLFGARAMSYPGAILLDGSGGQIQFEPKTMYPFTSDVCPPAAAPLYAAGHVVYQGWNTLLIFKGTD
jgi:outer membrane protein assembly factor BamB